MVKARSVQEVAFVMRVVTEFSPENRNFLIYF